MQRIQRRRTSTVKLGIEEPRMNEKNLYENEINFKNDMVTSNKQSFLNGEKLHLLINGSHDNDSYQHHSSVIDNRTTPEEKYSINQ